MVIGYFPKANVLETWCFHIHLFFYHGPSNSESDWNRLLEGSALHHVKRSANKKNACSCFHRCFPNEALARCHVNHPCPSISAGHWSHHSERLKLLPSHDPSRLFFCGTIPIAVLGLISQCVWSCCKRNIVLASPPHSGIGTRRSCVPGQRAS